MSDNYVTLQFEKFDSRSSFLEVCECFELDKIRLGFRSFDQNKSKGSRITASIDIYMSLRDANELAYQIQSKQIAKAKAEALSASQEGKPAAPLYKSKIGGTKVDGKIRYRDFAIFPGTKADYAIGANAGVGKQDEQGLIQKVGNPDTKIFIPLSEVDLRAFAKALTRAIASYDTVKAMEFFKMKAAMNKQNKP